MKTQPDSIVGISAGAIGDFRKDGAMRAAPKKVTTPHNRFFWWYSLSLLFLGPFGFIVGPLMARRGLRKAERLSRRRPTQLGASTKGLPLPSGGS